MEKNIFDIRYCEKKKQLNSKHFARLFKKVEKDVCKLEESLLVEDREQSCQHIKEKLFSVLENNNEISDSIFYSLLHKDTDQKEAKKQIYQETKIFYFRSRFNSNMYSCLRHRSMDGQ